MFDEAGNPVVVPPPEAPPQPAGPLMSIDPAQSTQPAPAWASSPVGASQSLGDFARARIPKPPTTSDGKPLTTLSQLQGMGGAEPSAPAPTVPAGISAYQGDSEALRTLYDAAIKQEVSKRPTYYAPTPEKRQDTGGQRQRVIGPDPAIMGRAREIQSGPQRLDRFEQPELRYSPLDVLSVDTPPPEAKTDKQKLAWAKRKADELTASGVSLSTALATGKIADSDTSWRPKGWDRMSGEEQEDLERGPLATGAQARRMRLIEEIDARHKRAVDQVSAESEAARARYDRDVELYGAEGIAGAVTAQARAAQRAEDAAVGTFEKKAAADQAFLTEKARLLAEQEEAGRATLAEINAAAADLKSAKIDPGAFWQSRTTSQKISLALASGMGAFAATMRGGRNFAQEIIDKAVDDDVKAQIANIDKKRADLTDGQKLYKQILDKTGDKIAAADALRLAAHSAVDSQLAEAQQTAKSEQALSRVQELRGRYELQRLEQEAALSERMRGTEATSFRVDPARAGGYGGGPNLAKIIELQKAKVAAAHGQAVVDMTLGDAAAKAAARAPQERAVLGGQTYDLTNVTSASEGAKVRDNLRAIQEMDYWLDRVEEAQKSFAGKHITQAQLDNAIQRYSSFKSQQEGQGVVRTEEAKATRDAMNGLVRGEDVIADLRRSHARSRDYILTQSGAVPRKVHK